MSDLTHFDSDGNARMVDVGGKPVTRRTARARGVIQMNATTADQIKTGGISKGDVLGVARTAGIMGSKLTPQLIPMCHPIAIDSVEIDFGWRANGELMQLVLDCNVSTTGKTGVEMEALTTASVTALTVYDMCKSVDREMEIKSVCLIEKTGGQSGHFVRKATED